MPSADTLERIGLAGRARARRLSAEALNNALDDEQKKALEGGIDVSVGLSPSPSSRVLTDADTVGRPPPGLTRKKPTRHLGSSIVKFHEGGKLSWIQAMGRNQERFVDRLGLTPFQRLDNYIL